MPIVSIFSGSFCREDDVVKSLQATTGYNLISDQDIVTRASKLSSIPPERLFRCFSNKLSAFNPFTRELERSLSWLKLALAEHLQKNNFILHGSSSHLIPLSISHALHVCLIADLHYRIHGCSRFCNINREDAAKRIADEDANKAAWVKRVKQVEDPWDSSLYDMVLPTNTLDDGKITELMCKGLRTNAVAHTDAGMQAVADFMEEARIETALARKGHAAQVRTNGTHVSLTIDRPVMMFERLEDELKSIVRTVSKDCNITVSVAPETDKPGIYRKYSPDTPSRVLLVDDEREFVQTLSERLEMRDIGSAVVYDGESALEMIEQDEPEVMLLDLQMPGINGIEVLKTVKKTHPAIEVIILTGHGTQKDKDICMNMGAFAYLEKPVDIDLLSQTIVRANERLRRKKNGGA